MRKKCFALSGLVAAGLSLLATQPAGASSHREALAILNEPCADNTDTFAWVSDGAHDKLYLVMDFNPLHEPGQGNQGLRACNGYRYEFQIPFFEMYDRLSRMDPDAINPAAPGLRGAVVFAGNGPGPSGR